MKAKNFWILIVMALFIACAGWKKKLKATPNYDETAINNAIVDFLNTSTMVEKFDTYHIIKVVDANTIGISIIGDTNKWKLGELKVGDKNAYFPSKVKEEKGKLFYWSDSTKVLTTEVINTMKKYDILDTAEYPNYIIPDEMGSSSKKAIHYFFCKTNYLKYKKIKSTVAIGYYEPPNLNCP